MIKTIAFYLPQYHQIRENDEWWGEGFTEWTNVRKAMPNYEGHYQPHIPSDDIGYYDLTDIEVQRCQIEIARQYGVYGFCYHHYWFSGRRLLEKPLQQVLSNKQLDFPFCICWANENWTRKWDGKDKEVLIAQDQTLESDNSFIDHLFEYFSDNRYIRIDDKPLLIIYKIADFLNPLITLNEWRRKAKERGLSDLFICIVDYHNARRPDEYGADALVEFPPHRLSAQSQIINAKMNFINPEFNGTCYDYNCLVAKSITKKREDFLTFRSVMPSWDNTARRQNNPLIFENSDPALFEFWFAEIVRQTLANEPSKQLIFVNAWNEWGEGCHLEPDQRYGYRYLQAIKDVLNKKYSTSCVTSMYDNSLADFFILDIENIRKVCNSYYRSLVALSSEISRLDETVKLLRTARKERDHLADSYIYAFYRITKNKIKLLIGLVVPHALRHKLLGLLHKNHDRKK